MIKADTRACDACGHRYEFTNHLDRCPICCLKPEPAKDDYEPDDWGSGDDDLMPESE